MRGALSRLSNHTNQEPAAGWEPDHRAKNRRWTAEELGVIQQAIVKLNQGFSIYSQVQWMRLKTILRSRTYESIRQKLKEKMMKRGAMRPPL